jgi:hypothetical protein
MRRGRISPLVLLLLLAIACGAADAQPRAMPRRQKRDCGAVGGECCPECMPDIPLSGGCCVCGVV